MLHYSEMLEPSEVKKTAKIGQIQSFMPQLKKPECCLWIITVPRISVDGQIVLNNRYRSQQHFLNGHNYT